MGTCRLIVYGTAGGNIGARLAIIKLSDAHPNLKNGVGAHRSKRHLEMKPADQFNWNPALGGQFLQTLYAEMYAAKQFQCYIVTF